MKKLTIISAAALSVFALASCEREKGFEPATVLDSEITVTATRDASTRSSLEVDETSGTPVYNVLWDAPDQILVTFPGAEPGVFASENEAPVAEADFTGHLPSTDGDASVLYGLYPAEEGNCVDAKGNFQFAFHDKQTAVAGSFDPAALPAGAVSDPGSTNLQFSNVCGLLKITVALPDISVIKLHPIKAALAPTRVDADATIPGGTLLVDFSGNEPELLSGTENLDTVTLLPPDGEEFFDPAETYYIVVPPCTLDGGAYFTLTRPAGDDDFVVSTDPVSVVRSKVHEVVTPLGEEAVVPVEEITINVDDEEVSGLHLEVGGEPVPFSITVKPEDATDPETEYESSDEDVVTVSEDGLVTAVGPGEATVTVTVTTPDGTSVSAEVTVTVTEPVVSVESISVESEEMELEIDSQDEIVVTFEPEDATNLELEYSSSDEDVATVDEDGVVTAVGPGTATITVTSVDNPQATATVTVTVTVPVESISVEPEKMAIETGSQDEIEVTFEPEDATNLELEYSSSDETIATVDEDGVVTAVAPGVVTITVTSVDNPEAIATVAVTVYDPVVHVESISVTDSQMNLAYDSEEEIEVTVEPENATDPSLGYSSSDEDVATVDENGTVTAVGFGTATITVTSVDNPQATAEVTVTVDPEFTTLNEMYDLEKDGIYSGTLENVIVTFVPDARDAVIKDASASMLIYKNGHGLLQGQTFSGVVTVKLSEYNNNRQISAIDATFEGRGAMVAPEIVTLDALASGFNTYRNAYVKVEDAEVTNHSSKNINVTDGTVTYLFYDNTGRITAETSNLITAAGTVTKYNDTEELKIWSADDATVTVVGPQSQNLAFSSSSVTYTRGSEEAFTPPTLSGAMTTVTYTSSNEQVAAVNSATGEVTIYTTGEAVITATAEATAEYQEGEASYTLTVIAAGQSISWIQKDLDKLADGDVVVLVGKVGDSYYAMSNDNGTSAAPSAVEVTPVAGDSNTTIEAPADNIQWTVHIAANEFQFSSGEDYLYCIASNNGLRVGSSSGNSFSLSDEGYLKNSAQGRYVGVYNKADWRCYTTINANIKDQSFVAFVKTVVAE